LSVTATQVLTLRQETQLSWFVSSVDTVDQELPPSLVPASASVELRPAAQRV